MIYMCIYIFMENIIKAHQLVRKQKCMQPLQSKPFK